MIVGLTGGIGSGKSTVAAMFRELGVPVYDSDAQAKSLMVGSPGLKRAIGELLGPKAYQGDRLDRPYVAKRVFRDPALLEKLNALVHPVVRQHFLAWAGEQPSDYVVQETALIFENGAQDQYDRVLLVTAPKELRLERVMQRDAAQREDVLQRMDNQLADEHKKGLADFTLENLDLDTTKAKVAELHRIFKGLASKF